MKMTKPVIKIGTKVVIFYVGGCFTLAVVLFGAFFLMVFGRHSHVAPNEIVECEAYTDLGLTPIEDELVCCDWRSILQSTRASKL